MIGETVTRLRGTEVAAGQGNTRIDWTTPTRFDIAGAIVAPRESAEDNQFRTAVIVGLTVYLPTGTALLPTDRLEVRGTPYEVVGEPGDFRNPYDSSIDGLQVALERING